MKTRFTLTSLALASLMMMGNTAMADVVTSGTSKSFNVKLTLKGSCEVFTVQSGKTSAIDAAEDEPSGADINFGSQIAATGSAEIEKSNVGQAANGIEVKCSKNTVFHVALQPGNGNTEGLGSMSGLKNTHQDTIPYQLYKPVIDNAGTAAEAVGNGISPNKWGTNENALSLTSKGLSTPIQLPVYAKIANGALADKTPDTYQDRVTVTLTY